MEGWITLMSALLMGTTCHCLLSPKAVLVRIVQAQDAWWIWMARVLQSLRLLAREARAWHVRAPVKRLGHRSIVATVHMVHLILASLHRIPRYLRTPVHALTATLTMIRLVPSLVPPLITKLPSAPGLTPGKSPLHLCHFFATLEGMFVREKVKKSLQTWTLS